jgi:site-specific DNA recombinase
MVLPPANAVYTGALVWGESKNKHNGGSHLPVIRVEDAWPAIIDRDTFDKVGVKLTERAPKITHPRVVHSEYLLSGLVKCKTCNAALVGHAVKSGKFFYYMCGNARKRGREFCKTPLLPKERIENFVVDRLKQYILTEENLEDLVKLTNEELAKTCEGETGRLDTLKSEIKDVDSRLARLYDALETGEFERGHLAPRIKALFDRKEELERVRIEVENSLKYHTVEIASPEVVKTYAESMRTLLEESSIMQKKAFLRSFVDRIEVDDEYAKVVYTMPMLPNNLAAETVGVLPFVHDGPV